MTRGKPHPLIPIHFQRLSPRISLLIRGATQGYTGRIRGWDGVRNPYPYQTEITAISGGLDAQSFCEKLEPSSGLIEESQITSHESEIIEKVGSHHTNHVENPELLPDGNLSQPTNPLLTPCDPRQTPHSSDESTPQSVAASNQPTADQVATTESELVQKLRARILKAIADKNPATANDVYCQVHELGVKEAVKALLTNDENEDFRRLVKVWKKSKSQP